MLSAISIVGFLCEMMMNCVRSEKCFRYFASNPAFASSKAVSISSSTQNGIGRILIIANKIAGYAGRGVFPVALAMVYKVFEAVKIPIIGCGGVESAEDVIEMMLAGATAV